MDEGDRKSYGLANTAHSEIAHSLPLPSLPIAFGASSQGLSLFEDENIDRRARESAIMSKAGKIAELLANTDTSYITLKDEGSVPPVVAEPGSLAATVLGFHPQAFDCRPSAHLQSETPKPKSQPSSSSAGRKGPLQSSEDQGEQTITKKPRLKRKHPNDTDRQGSEKRPGESARRESKQNGIVSGICELLNDFLERSDGQADADGEEEGTILSLQEMRSISEEITSLHARAAVYKIPSEKLMKLLSLLDRHVRHAHLKEIDEGDDVDSDNFEIVMTALEAVQITLMIMSSPKMPKQIYKEEVIDRIIEFTRYQIVHSVFTAYDPLYRQMHKNAGEEDEVEDEEEEGKKNRRKSRSGKPRKSTSSRVSTVVSTVLHKLCSILALLKDLLSAAKLLDSTILQLTKTVLGTFGVDNIQLLQLKSVGVACMIFNIYPQHQTVIIDEVLSMLWKLPSSKKNARTYHLPEEEHKQIQMLVALLLQLVQCSVDLPEPSQGIETESSDTRKCFEPAVSICNYFWRNVFQRWAIPKVQEGSDVKAVMENLVLDLLTTINVPEFPAASLLLQVLCVLLLGPAGVKSKDVAVRVAAIDILGQIAAHLKRDAVAYSQDDFWILQEIRDDPVASSKDACASCTHSRAGKFMLRCDYCKRWFHGDCVGVTEQDLIGRGWFCHCCLCRNQLASFNSGSAEKIEDGFKIPDEGAVIVQQILLNFLRETGSGDNLSFFARRFYLCLWYGYDPQGVHSLAFYHWRSGLKAPHQDFGISSAAISRDSIVRITRALSQQRPLARGFDRILERLLASLQENASNPRAKALKAVSAIVEVDPGVLADGRVQKAVEGRFMDSAISVREAAMELVGRHIVSRPDVAIKYFDRLSERIMDTGVSVRKRVIKIVRDFCLSKGGFPKATDACIRVISRINDDEASIQDLVCKTFYEMWFEEHPGHQTQFAADGSVVPSEIAERAQQLVDVLKSLPTNQPIVTVIRRSLSLDFIPQGSKTAAPTNISQALVRNRCELMCKYLVECILKAEETSEDSEAQALPYVSALHAFCIVDPTLCAPASDPSRFAVTLQPYLKTLADNRDIAQLLQSIVYVIDTVLPLLRRPPQSFVEELERDLRQLIVRYSFLTVVHACIKCLASLTKISPKRGQVFDFLVRQFYKVLDSWQDSELIPEKPNILRSLFCLGLFVRYGAELIDSMNDNDVSMDSILNLYAHYLQSEDFEIKLKALQAVGFVFLARPDFMMNESIGKVLGDSLISDSRLKMQTLRNFYEYLIDVEKQMGSAEQKNGENRDSTAAVPIAAGAGDSNICGGIIQLHWDRILERCLDADEQVRQAAVKVVDAVLRQGLVHPMTCVPQLIALEVDQQESISKLAHRLLSNLNEKYPSFFETRLGDGLQLSFTFIQSGAAQPARIKNNISQSEAAYARAGISRIYKLIRGSRNSRNKFLSSVVRKFDWVSSQASTPFLIYCTEILVSLPFNLQEEPLYLIFAVNRILQVRAGDLEASIKAEFSQEPLSNLLKQTQTTEPEAVATDSVQIPPELMKNLEIQSDAAVALSLLLKMKRHLKITFCLDDARCQAFQPSDPAKPADIVSRQAGKEFDCTDIPSQRPENVSQVVQRYQLFKSLLKADTMDYSAYASPAPSRKRGRSSAAAADGLYQGNGHAGSKMRRKSAPPAPAASDDDDGDPDADEEHRRTTTPSKAKRKGKSKKP